METMESVLKPSSNRQSFKLKFSRLQSFFKNIHFLLYRNYLNEEHKDKKGSPYDLSDWNFLHNKNLPQQMNGSDCGMFACKYAEYLSRGKTSFNFNQVSNNNNKRPLTT